MLTDLNINGTIYAKYQIKDKILYLKMISPFYGKSIFESEEIAMSLIDLIEDETITHAAYLNI